MKAAPCSSRAALCAVISLFNVHFVSSALAQVNSTNIAGTNNVVQATASNSAILGGQNNFMAGINSGVVGGANGRVSSGAAGAFIGGGNVGLIGTNASLSVVLGGLRNTVTNNSQRSAIVGGFSNVVASVSSGVVGGESNLVVAGANRAFIGGGQFNEVRAPGGAVVGGFANEAAGTNSFAAGSQAVASNTGTFVWADMSSPTDFVSTGNNQFLIRANGGVGINTNNAEGHALIVRGSVRIVGPLIPGNGTTVSGSLAAVGGGLANTASGALATIGGGAFNTASGSNSTVGGGTNNTAAGHWVTIGGGQRNSASTNHAVVGGGFSNEAEGLFSTVAGGRQNKAAGSYSVVGGGNTNQATGDWATVAGGQGNSADYAGAVGGGQGNAATGAFSAIPGGAFNVAGTNSFAAGRRAKATNSGSFVWSGVGSVDTSSTNDNSFTVRAPGGVRFITSAWATNFPSLFPIYGVFVAPGGTAWTALSDRESKTDFQPVEPREVLSKLVAMPVTSWRYKHDPSRRYIGPTSQDFMAAFHLGDYDKGISTLDADGVTFAAIKGLMEEIKLRDKKIAQLEEVAGRREAGSKATIEELKADLRSLREEVRGSLPPRP